MITYADMVNADAEKYHHAMTAIEVNVARGIVRFLRLNPRLESAIYALNSDYLMLPLSDQWFAAIQALWGEMNAENWLREESPHTLLWGVSVLRASRYLKTDSYLFPEDEP